MEETGRDRGKLCELTLTRPLQSVPIIGSMLCAYFVLLVVLALPFTPTLTDLLPAHLHLRHSYTLSLHMLSQITIHSPSPCSLTCTSHALSQISAFSQSLTHTLAHSPTDLPNVTEGVLSTQRRKRLARAMYQGREELGSPITTLGPALCSPC